jgi:hypothetical protein
VNGWVRPEGSDPDLYAELMRADDVIQPLYGEDRERGDLRD